MATLAACATHGSGTVAPPFSDATVGAGDAFTSADYRVFISVSHPAIAGVHPQGSADARSLRCGAAVRGAASHHPLRLERTVSFCSLAACHPATPPPHCPASKTDVEELAWDGVVHEENRTLVVVSAPAECGKLKPHPEISANFITSPSTMLRTYFIMQCRQPPRTWTYTRGKKLMRT